MFLNVCDIEFKIFCSKDFFRIEMTAVFSYMWLWNIWEGQKQRINVGTRILILRMTIWRALERSLGDRFAFLSVCVDLVFHFSLLSVRRGHSQASADLVIIGVSSLFFHCPIYRRLLATFLHQFLRYKR